MRGVDSSRLTEQEVRGIAWVLDHPRYRLTEQEVRGIAWVLDHPRYRCCHLSLLPAQLQHLLPATVRGLQASRSGTQVAKPICQ